MINDYLKLTLCFLLLATISCERAHAGELYKWKDKKGVVHYSEKKPENDDDAETQVSVIEVEKQTKFIHVDTLKAIRKHPEINTRHIVLVKQDPFWQLNNDQSKVVTYYFGGDCVSPTSANFQQLVDNHKSILPSASRVSNSIIKAIHQLDYSATASFRKPLKNHLARHDKALTLWFKLVALDLHLCKKNLSHRRNRGKRIQMGFDPFDYVVGNYNRRKAGVTLEWKLQDSLTGKIIYTGKTSGTANHWQKNIDKFKLTTIQQALQNSLYNLFSQSELVDLLTDMTPAKPRIPKARKIRAAKEPGIFDQLSDMFISKAKERAAFANVISKVQPLKIMVTEYYVTQGRWPESFQNIGISPSQLSEENYIVNIEIDYDGTLIINLDSANFESNSSILLTPQTTLAGTSINWLCRSNLPSSYLGNYCQVIVE